MWTMCYWIKTKLINTKRLVRFFFAFYLLPLYVSNPVICKWVGNNWILGSIYGIQKKKKREKNRWEKNTEHNKPCLTGSFFYGSLIRGYYHSRKYFLFVSIATTTTTNYEIYSKKHVHLCFAQTTTKDLETFLIIISNY